jgi:hypothetical protein
MVAVSYVSLHMFWGALDLDAGSGAYTPSERVSGGPSAVEGEGIGVRRVLLKITPPAPGGFTDDVRVMHFDFLNLTGGAPDDTWTDTDYAQAETAVENWFGAVQSCLSTTYTFHEARWYRIGPGVNPPNPAQKVFAVTNVGSSSSAELPPQCALSITLKTAARKQWGRTYLPGLTTAMLGGFGLADSTKVNLVGAATDALIAEANTHDLHLVVYSPTKQAANTVESVQVDNVIDVIRSRRWRNATHKYVTP